MHSHGCDGRRRPSLTLDAGYVSVPSTNIYETSEVIGLHGKKLICLLLTIISLVFISFINLICLLWLMHKLDWSFSDTQGSRLFRIDEYKNQVEFYNRVTFNDGIYASTIDNQRKVRLSSGKQIDLSGDQNSILFDDDQILLTTDKFLLNNYSSVDFSNVYDFKFNDSTNTRIHLNEFNSQYIRNKNLNLSAIDHLIIKNTDHTFFYGQSLLLEAERNNRRSVLRFSNYPIRKKSIYDHKISSENLHFKSDSVFFDLPRLPLLGNTHRSESGIYRICICNTTFLFLRSSAHQPCPLFQ